MKLWHYGVILLFFLVLYAVIYKTAKKKKPLLRAFLSMLIGVLSLLAVDAVSGYTGVYLPVSAFTLCVSATLGVPAVASMLVICFIL